MKSVYTTECGGRKLEVEFGVMAKQANAAVLVKYGDTYVLVTATSSKKPKEGLNFLPLTVDYEERMYAAGKIPGGWLRREGRPADRAVLSSRLTDRTIRPLFPKHYRNEIQIIATVLSMEKGNATEFAGMLGASLALSLSDIPFDGPIAAVIIGQVDGEFVVNPTIEQAEKSALNLTVAGTKEAVLMVEAEAHEVSESTMLEALKKGHEEIKKLVVFQEHIVAEKGQAKQEVPVIESNTEIIKVVDELAFDALDCALRVVDKHQREQAISDVEDTVMEKLLETYTEEEQTEISTALYDLRKRLVRKMILEESLRPDGRTPDEIRPISSEVGIIPRVHGSGLFTRGQTQVLSITTLGTVGDSQILDDIGNEEGKRYMHHYNFPPFSTGEAYFLRGPNRRAIGHGILAEKALVHLLPDEEAFPYTIRVVSEVLESNGSSSMASVCGSTLALMDAGVPIIRPVAGIAMGMIQEGDKAVVLSDIQGMEDFLGDMDFKVAGTKLGITAIQMDMKVSGISFDMLEIALQQSHAGRMYILNKMLEVLPEPRAELSPYAPRMFTTTIPVDKIKDVIGPGGKIINKIIAETGVKIDIEEDGRIFIAAEDGDNGERALEMIAELTREAEIGALYHAKVMRTERYGAFAEILPGKDGLIHISELAEGRVNRTEDIVKVGDKIWVKVTGIDEKGRINLSHKEALAAGKSKPE